MKIEKTELPDLVTLEPLVFMDSRGYFMEAYNKGFFYESGIAHNFVQDNQSGSKKGVLRGMHYQLYHTQGKLVRTLVGKIYNAVVDLRLNSLTFGKWLGVYLSAEEKTQLWVPKGFANGFYVISDYAEILYKTTDYYNPLCERTLLWNDLDVGIEWPLENDCELLISEKDLNGEAFKNLEYFKE